MPGWIESIKTSCCTIFRHLCPCIRNIFDKTGDGELVFIFLLKWQSSPEVYKVIALVKMESAENVKPGGR